MIILNGKNLGERQRDLNENVNVTKKNKLDFKTAKKKNTKTDIDNFYNIDLAAKYKEIDYIVEVLKSGDGLHVTRAINKCDWLCDEEYKHLINTDYLTTNIFRAMSIKMRNKLLVSVATNLKKDDPRSADFYTFCMKTKLHNIALKYLINTPESLKLEIINQKSKMFRLITEKEGKYLEHFIGNSLDLAEAYVNNIEYVSHKAYAVYLLRYMYTLSNERYLNMLETTDTGSNVIGRRISKHILQNYKGRVMNKPLLYATVLNKDVIKRNVTSEEAKIFAIALLPSRSSAFFYNYCEKSKFVLDLIPQNEKFSFVKKIFNEKYEGEAFETSPKFYDSEIFEIMNTQEKESWALQNIANQNEILGSGNDYLWYKFVKFDVSFEEIRNQIKKTSDDMKRCNMLITLIDSAKNEEELTRLLNYYGDRHRNEVINVTLKFLEKLFEKHTVWRFGENCWQALEKIFYIIEVFNKSKDKQYKSKFCELTLMYYILNKKPVPDILHEYLETNVITFNTIRQYIKSNELTTDANVIYQYILEFYTEKIKSLTVQKHNNDAGIKESISKYIRLTLRLAEYWGKTKEDLSELILSNIKQNQEEFKGKRLLAPINKLTASEIMHFLKKDAALVVDQFPKIKEFWEYNTAQINWLVQKLNIYFSNDLSKQYVNLFQECLSASSIHYQTADIAVRGILILADENKKNMFLENYAPKEKTIDRAKLSENTWYIQRAICRHMRSARPPLPLSIIFKYVTGDYVKFCLALFRSYLVHLPSQQCTEFVQKMIDSPVSIQKHGLRLAFECFDSDKLQLIISESWKRTKNVSLRTVLYKLLSSKVSNEEMAFAQLQLFDVLLVLTLDLNEDDQESLELVHSLTLPDQLIGRYLEAVWKTISSFSEKPQNFELKTKVLRTIEKKLTMVPENCMDNIIADCFKLDHGEINKTKKGYDNLLTAAWNLIMSFLVYMPDEKRLEKSMLLNRQIIKDSVKSWNIVDESTNKYVSRALTRRLIAGLDTKSFDHDEKCYPNFITLMRAMEKELIVSLPETEIYNLLWVIRSSILLKDVFIKLNIDRKVPKTEDMIKCGIILGNDFASLIKEYVENGSYHHVFCESIINVADNCMQNIFSHFRYHPFDSSDMQILFCSGLLEHNMFETHMLALKMLPIKYDGKFMEDYIKVIKGIQHFQSKELQLYLYEKFVNTDFEKRSYIKL